MNKTETKALLQTLNGLKWNEKLKVLRVVNNLTQEETAQMCGTSQKVYWCWEKGKNFPRKYSQRAISQIFNIAPSDIW